MVVTQWGFAPVRLGLLRLPFLGLCPQACCPMLCPKNSWLCPRIGHPWPPTFQIRAPWVCHSQAYPPGIGQPAEPVPRSCISMILTTWDPHTQGMPPRLASPNPPHPTHIVFRIQGFSLEFPSCGQVQEVHYTETRPALRLAPEAECPIHLSVFLIFQPKDSAAMWIPHPSEVM
jgi:hypothetical protein